MLNLTSFLKTSYTAYQAVDNAKEFLREQGFTELSEGAAWQLAAGGKYFVTRSSSSLVAFRIPKETAKPYFKIIASHTDSPSFKIKSNALTFTHKYAKLNTERYGGGLYYTFLDRPLKLAGRVVIAENGTLRSQNYVSSFQVVIPSVAIHMNPEANSALTLNLQTDLLPLIGMNEADLFADFVGQEVVSYDLYATCAQEPFQSGVKGEFLSSPRIDNLTSVCLSLNALTQAEASSAVNVAACFDNEEVGSATWQGAGSDFLECVLRRIGDFYAFTEAEYRSALARSFAVSLDNAHALHPNHPEKCDPTNACFPGGGVAIKYHANKAYTTDALSSAIIKKVFQKAGQPVQEFCNRADMRSGFTLGASSLSHIAVLTVDMGLAQLAMHSAVETFSLADYQSALVGFTAYYASEILLNGQEATVL